MKTNWSGVYTALVTPFREGEIDVPSLVNLALGQARQGVDGLIVAGTTGESPTLSSAEKKTIFEILRSELGSSFPLMVGTGTNCTETTVRATQDAESWGADGVLVVTPYYNKPPQSGLLRHFEAVARATSLPVLLYNVPGRTGVKLAVETVAQLATVENIVGIKEASGDLEYLRDLIRTCPRDFQFLSGDDETFLEFCRLGGCGVISVLSHLVPAWMKKRMVEVRRQSSGRGDTAEGKVSVAPYVKLTQLLFVQANPIPVKTALQYMGWIQSDELRMPLVPMEEPYRGQLLAEMKNLGLEASQVSL